MLKKTTVLWWTALLRQRKWSASAALTPLLYLFYHLAGSLNVNLVCGALDLKEFYLKYTTRIQNSI